MSDRALIRPSDLHFLRRDETNCVLYLIAVWTSTVVSRACTRLLRPHFLEAGRARRILGPHWGLIGLLDLRSGFSAFDGLFERGMSVAFTCRIMSQCVLKSS